MCFGWKKEILTSVLYYKKKECTWEEYLLETNQREKYPFLNIELWLPWYLCKISWFLYIYLHLYFFLSFFFFFFNVLPLTVWITINCGTFLKRWNIRPLYLPPSTWWTIFNANHEIKQIILVARNDTENSVLLFINILYLYIIMTIKTGKIE